MSFAFQKTLKLGVNYFGSICMQSKRCMGKLDRFPVFKPSRKQPRKWTSPVVLRQDVPKLGREGDVVFVKRGYARNELVPNRLAYYGTVENIEKYAVLNRPKEDIMIDAKLAKRLESLTLQFQRPRDQVWEIDEHHIARLCKKCGIHVPVNCITLDENTPIVDFGSYQALITVDNKIDFTINIKVDVWTPRIDKDWMEILGDEAGNLDEQKLEALLSEVMEEP